MRKLSETMTLKGCILLLLGFAKLLAAQTNPSVTGKGWGLDHVLVVAPSAQGAQEIFGAKIGFSPVPGTKFPGAGLENAVIWLPPAYIEILWPYDEPTALGAAVGPRKKAAAGGGPLGYNIDVSPVADAVAFLRGLGLAVTLPGSATTRTADGKEAPGA